MNKVKTAVKQKSVLTEKEKNLVDLALGKKEAKTVHDRKLVEQINEIRKKGTMLYIPYD
ncbi:MAG: hypothetical protein ABW019_17785 [Chitinophagaceae bacterium]